MVTLSRAEWSERRRRHRERVDVLLAGHRWRSDRGIQHPVEDFLFEYYTFRPSQLRRWHPGDGVVLANAPDWAERDYQKVGDGVRLDTAALLRARGGTPVRAYALLRATAARRPAFGCFGMHEWAMVDGVRGAEHTRHPQLGLRLAPERVSAVLRAVGIRCTHFDAYRFFTPTAKPLNEYAPTRDNQIELDQPGCLHVGMDLYRIAYKLSPLIESELVADCFELARRIRVLDMRASPYDLTSLDLAPVPVETAAGRAEYAAAQRELALAAAPLRTRLLERVAALLSQ